MSTPTPRTSAAIIASGFQAVPEGFRAFAGILERELTALTAELALLREWQREVIQNANAHHAERKDAIARAERAEAELAAEREKVTMLLSDAYALTKNWHDRAERAEAELADQAARFHDEIVRRQGTVRANQELDLKERDHLLDLLRDDWARLEKMRTLLTASNAKLALIFGELTAGESRTVRAVLKYVLSIH